MKQTIIFSCMAFMLGAFCTHAFHSFTEQQPKYSSLNQQGKTNSSLEFITPENEKTYNEIAINQQSSHINTAVKSSSQKASAATIPAPPKAKLADDTYEQIKTTQGILQASKNEAERLSALDTLFENAEADSANDPAHELKLGDFFREDNQLVDYTPQSIQCHANTCKLEFPINDSAQVEQMLNTLSAKILSQDLQASHIFAAENAAKGTTHLYVSLLENN